MAMDNELWTTIQKRLNYTDEEMALFKSDPKNLKILSKSADLMNKTIVAEVVESQGCNSGHKVGDKFFFDGAGNLLTKLGPKRICIYALGPLQPAIFATNELCYAGVEPNELLFRKAGCLDVGVRCGGWGHINMEISVQDRKTTQNG